MPTADELLGAGVVDDLVGCLERAAPGVRADAVRRAAGALAPLAFGQRVTAVSDAVLQDLPDDVPAFAAVLRRALEDPSFSGWMIWAVADAASRRAVDAHEASGGDALTTGLDLMRELTPRHSAEAAIRRLLQADADRALALVTGWTGDPDEHVRRLASEGTRPFLPWARRVPALLGRPGATVPILDALHDDPSAYVRRSVANHLNDLSRVDPALAVATATRWRDADPDGTAWVVRHAMRTLVKAGDPGALTLHGFAAPGDELVVTGPDPASDAVRMGEDLVFAVLLENRGDTELRLAIDYVVHHRKANGALAPKVFKLTTRTLAPGATETLTGRRPFRPITTRTYHAGEHALELQVNGRRYGRVPFDLVL
ncbi:DNA alkylation repair protein [Patulibacter minatonensis]|uniref:DNA alkylation repair protein n=1 Tax=Patulibacter minatonensis TaxID=298163 RepID=UPI00047AD858|nr:DNA alkylation repair protein [Patulibacter minatonensis]